MTNPTNQPQQPAVLTVEDGELERENKVKNAHQLGAGRLLYERAKRQLANLAVRRDGLEQDLAVCRGKPHQSSTRKMSHVEQIELLTGQLSDLTARLGGTVALEYYLELQARCEGLVAERDEIMLALEHLTPGGSEFVGDVERCVAHVKERQRSQHEAIKRFKKERDRLVGQLGQAHAVLKAVVGFCVASAGRGVMRQALREAYDRCEQCFDWPLDQRCASCKIIGAALATEPPGEPGGEPRKLSIYRDGIVTMMRMVADERPKGEILGKLNYILTQLDERPAEEDAP